MVTDDILFHLFPTFDPLTQGPKSTRLKKIQISTWKHSQPEGNFSPIWRSSLGHLLLDTVDDSIVCFTMLTNIISSNPILHMVVPIFDSYIYTSTLSSKVDNREQKATKTLQAQRKS